MTAIVEPDKRAEHRLGYTTVPLLNYPWGGGSILFIVALILLNVALFLLHRNYVIMGELIWSYNRETGELITFPWDNSMLGMVYGKPLIYATALIWVAMVITKNRTWKAREALNAQYGQINEKILGKWKDNFYCSRCDNVFLAGSGSAITVKQFRSDISQYITEQLAATRTDSSDASEGHRVQSGSSG